jgi:putative hemolysin
MAMGAVLVHACGNPLATTERFRVSMAQTLEDVIQCQRLRYLVFNCELGEGLDSSAYTGLDRDRYDFICDHLRDVPHAKWLPRKGKPGLLRGGIF